MTQDYISIDLETTGLQPKKNVILLKMTMTVNSACRESRFRHCRALM